MKKIIITLFAALFLMGCSTSVEQRGNPAFWHAAIQNEEGIDVTLNHLRGELLVINSWATWCPFCVEELKDFDVAQSKFGEQVQFVLVNRKEGSEVADTYLNDLGISSNMITFLDETDEFYKAIQGFSMPETIFVNKDGTIQYHKRGFMTRQEIFDRTNDLIDANK
jgi:thiol-disulfide isomerase/thioredoxin